MSQEVAGKGASPRYPIHQAFPHEILERSPDRLTAHTVYLRKLSFGRHTLAHTEAAFFEG